MFFYPTALAEPGLHQFGKQLFLKSAESRFPKTAETDFSDFCRNKITIYSHELLYASPILFQRHIVINASANINHLSFRIGCLCDNRCFPSSIIGLREPQSI